MKHILLLTTAFLFFTINIHSQTVETIVGTGVAASYPALGAGANGDGLVGTSTNIAPGGGSISCDANGNIYFIDRHGLYIRKRNVATAVITTIAGNGTGTVGGYSYIDMGVLSGEGGAATAVGISATCICVSLDGNYLYFSESAYETLRMVNLNTGIITTVCGYNSQPLGGAPYCSPQVVNDHLAAKYARIKTTSTNSIAIDELNNLYVADGMSYRRIRKINRNPATGTADGNSSISTIAYGIDYASATDGISGYASIPQSGPNLCQMPAGGYLGSNSGGLDVVYKSGYLYFIELNSSATTVLRFRRMNLTTMAITTIGSMVDAFGGGAGIPSVNTASLAVDAANNMYATDLYNGSIYKMTLGGVSSIFYTRACSIPNCTGPFPSNTPLASVNNFFNNGGGITYDAFSRSLIYMDGGYYLMNKVSLCSTVIDPITGPDNLCAGSSITLSNATPGGVWLSFVEVRASIDAATGVVTGRNAGTTVVRYTLPGIAGTVACPNFVEKLITVNRNPPIPSMAFSRPPPVYVNPYCSFVAGFKANALFGLEGFPAGGSWSSTGAVSTITVLPSGIAEVRMAAASGPFTISYRITTPATGCFTTRAYGSRVYNTPCRGAASLPKANTTNIIYSVFPNPAHNYINIKVDKLFDKGSMVITNLLGKQLKQQAISLGTNTVDVSNLSKGIYLLSIITEQGKEIQKIMVE